MSLWSMYTWYSQLLLTMVHLKDILGQLNVNVNIALLDSILDHVLKEFVDCRWNKCAWTLQEYFVSRVIHFYTEDWKLYLPISKTEYTNHKMFATIKQGMKAVTSLDVDSLAVLKPGSQDTCKELHLAMICNTRMKEDMVYSLLSIFKITIEAIYSHDEMPHALGHLLEALLTTSSNITILAWTG